MSIDAGKWIPWLPALAAVLCGVCCTRRALRSWAAPICIVGLATSFLLTMLVRGHVQPGDDPKIVTFMQWIEIGSIAVHFSYLFDSLTLLMLMVVTGIGTLVAIYAAGYMSGDRGYARFFAGVSLFIFAMTSLVMADNLVLLYLGWEGVGLCSYLLIGFYYEKPSAVAAAKKAFIVNRIGDFGFALGIFMIYTRYGTLDIAAILKYPVETASDWRDTWIPFMLMLGAFGKSAQIPLYVWLPDAMEGPTPVSALIHAATMVTAGVYMIARLLPIFELSPYALPTVAVIGGLTALFAATIALCQYDIKRIFAYSTISQLGYMFLGVGVLSTVGGVFHLFTHAFFKALLFLTAGSVMHALTGQLDLRRMSGLRKKMPITCWLMFIGCLALAGVPGTAGFFSKDMILAATLEKGVSEHAALYTLLAIVGLGTALLTAYYTFRLWFRVFLGPTEYEMGDEHHGADDASHHHVQSAHEDDAAVQVEHVHDAHEMPWLMNGPLVVLAIGAIASGWLASRGEISWIEGAVHGSTARPQHVAELAEAAPHDDHGHGHSIHNLMVLLSILAAGTGIAIAAWFHWWRRDAADRLASRWRGAVRLLANKYYVDEILDLCVVRPLRGLGEVFHLVDRMIVDGLVSLFGFLPRGLGLTLQTTARGAMQGYAIGMVLGIAVLLILLLL